MEWMTEYREAKAAHDAAVALCRAAWAQSQAAGKRAERATKAARQRLAEIENRDRHLLGDIDGR